MVSNITPLPSLLFTRQLAHYLHHQPILLNALNVVLGLVQRTLPVSLLPKIPETLEAIGVLVHTDHHRRSTFRVSFSANAATSKVIFVVLHHLLYRLFQSRDVFSLLVDPLSRQHCFHFLNAQLVEFGWFFLLFLSSLSEKIFQNLSAFGWQLGRARFGDRLLFHFRRFLGTFLQPQFGMFKDLFFLIGNRLRNWRIGLDDRLRQLNFYLCFFGQATTHYIKQQSSYPIIQISSPKKIHHFCYNFLPQQYGYFAARFKQPVHYNIRKLFIGGSMTTIQGWIALILLAATCMGQNCDAGSFFDGTDCTPCHPACISCISTTICTLCHPQAYLIVTGSGLSCEICTDLIEGCAVCYSKDVCSACQAGFYLNGNICSPSLGGGQISLSPPQVTCKSYEKNINGACYPAIPLCATYNPDASCQICQHGALLIQRYCIPSSIASPNPTQAPSSDGASLVCQERQFISNGECVTIGPACLTFQINGTCTECDTGFTLFRGLCVQDPKDGLTIISYIPTLWNRDSNNNSQKNQENSSSPEKNRENHTEHPSCEHSCATCTQDPSYCLTCIDGYVTVDYLPGRCFHL